MKTLLPPNALELRFLMILLFLTLTVSIIQTIFLLNQRRFRKYAAANILWSLLLFSLLFNLYNDFINMGEMAALRFVLNLHSHFYWGMLILTWLNNIILWFRHGNENYLNQQSVKEAIDTLPLGIAYFNENSQLKLCNKTMYNLFYTLTGKELKYLQDLDYKSEISPLYSKSLPEYPNAFYFPNGEIRVLVFNSVQTMDGQVLTEVLCSNMTTLYHKRIELEQQLNALKENAGQLRKLSAQIQEKTKEEEILAAKRKLHDQMGSSLLTIRHALLSQSKSESALKAALNPIYDTINSLQKNIVHSGKEGKLDEFLSNAQAVGVIIQITGKWPENLCIREIILQVLQECLTNAVRHADAKHMDINFSENESFYFVDIANDGILPSKPVVPKGGLLNVRHYVENFGGELYFITDTDFTVKLKFLK